MVAKPTTAVIRQITIVRGWRRAKITSKLRVEKASTIEVTALQPGQIMNQQPKKYSFRALWTRAALRGGGSVFSISLLLLGLALIMSPGCTGFADTVREDHEQPQDNREETAQALYEAMVEVFEEETPGVDIAMESTFTVLSRYETVEEGRRRRFVGRVVPLQGGIGVRVSAEYQRGVHDDDIGGVRWENEDREAIEEEASPDELRIARRVERRFHRGE